ncbi:uncharacterized [Tachysurus ichikawai]
MNQREGTEPANRENHENAPHLGVRFDHPEVWRKEPPSSQISYGALLQAWHVYQAESTTHPLQPPARDRWEEDQRNTKRFYE